MNARPVVVWRLLDGKPGHENQTRGLVRALGRHRALVVHDQPVPARAAALRDALLGRWSPGVGLPDPDLLLGAGHATHLPLLAARRARGGRCVVLMRPSLPLAWFDLCLIPRHDDPPARSNVLATRGVLNAIEPSTGQDPDAGLLLIGGPSRHHGWDRDGLLAQLRAIVGRDTRRWQLTTSRRTPEDTERALRERAVPGPEVVPWRETDRDWLPRRLRRAAVVWITADSVSMVYESLTAGAACGLLAVPEHRPGRVVRGIAELQAEGLITPFDAWARGAALRPPAVPFDEARRCADWIAHRWLNG
ncbi:MAG: mitochondrial fission ELM1 family protein [Candidatus Competibacterales bacterium]|nr:mitochondrial fission ELM1 family protein [Candidatus Competibacterales bacterium]